MFNDKPYLDIQGHSSKNVKKLPLEEELMLCLRAIKDRLLWVLAVSAFWHIARYKINSFKVLKESNSRSLIPDFLTMVRPNFDKTYSPADCSFIMKSVFVQKSTNTAIKVIFLHRKKYLVKLTKHLSVRLIIHFCVCRKRLKEWN